MQTFRIEVGHAHGVKPGNIVGAVANEAGLDAKNIGRIEIYDDYSMLDLPADMPKQLLERLRTVWVAGQQLHISRDGEQPDVSGKSAGKKAGFKAKSDFGNRSFDAAKPKPKSHRKGPKPT
jgi:ATP-dependent RNA helicase DeaD